QRALAAVGESFGDAVGHVQDRPVVAPARAQCQRFDLGEIGGETAHIVGAGTSPPVDGLSGSPTAVTAVEANRSRSSLSWATDVSWNSSRRTILQRALSA